MIDLNDKDVEDRIPLREMIIRATSSNLAPLPNSTSLSFAEPRLKLRDEDLKDEEF